MRVRTIGIVLSFAGAASAGPTAPSPSLTTTAQPVAVMHPSLLVRPQLRRAITLKDAFATSNPMPAIPPPPPRPSTTTGPTFSLTRSCANGGTMQVAYQGSASQTVDPTTGAGSYLVSATFTTCGDASGTVLDGTIVLGFQGSGRAVQTGSTSTATGHWTYSFDGLLHIKRGNSSAFQATFRAFTVAVDFNATAAATGTTVTQTSETMKETLNGTVTMDGQATTYANDVVIIASGAT